MNEGDDKLLIVPTRSSPEAGHFAVAEGYLTQCAGWPVDNLTAGLERAGQRLAQLARPHQHRRRMSCKGASTPKCHAM